MGLGASGQSETSNTVDEKSLSHRNQQVENNI